MYLISDRKIVLDYHLRNGIAAMHRYHMHIGLESFDAVELL